MKRRYISILVALALVLTHMGLTAIAQQQELSLDSEPTSDELVLEGAAAPANGELTLDMDGGYVQEYDDGELMLDGDSQDIQGASLRAPQGSPLGSPPISPMSGEVPEDKGRGELEIKGTPITATYVGSSITNKDIHMEYFGEPVNNLVVYPPMNDVANGQVVIGGLDQLITGLDGSMITTANTHLQTLGDFAYNNSELTITLKSGYESLDKPLPKLGTPDLTIDNNGGDTLNIIVYPSSAWDFTISDHGKILIHDGDGSPFPLTGPTTSYGVIEPDQPVTIEFIPDDGYVASYTAVDIDDNDIGSKSTTVDIGIDFPASKITHIVDVMFVPLNLIVTDGNDNTLLHQHEQHDGLSHVYHIYPLTEDSKKVKVTLDSSISQKFVDQSLVPITGTGTPELHANYSADGKTLEITIGDNHKSNSSTPGTRAPDCEVELDDGTVLYFVVYPSAAWTITSSSDIKKVNVFEKGRTPSELAGTYPTMNVIYTESNVFNIEFAVELNAEAESVDVDFGPAISSASLTSGDGVNWTITIPQTAVGSRMHQVTFNVTPKTAPPTLSDFEIDEIKDAKQHELLYKKNADDEYEIYVHAGELDSNAHKFTIKQKASANLKFVTSFPSNTGITSINVVDDQTLDVTLSSTYATSATPPDFAVTMDNGETLKFTVIPVAEWKIATQTGISNAQISADYPSASNRFLTKTDGDVVIDVTLNQPLTATQELEATITDSMDGAITGTISGSNTSYKVTVDAASINSLVYEVDIQIKDNGTSTEKLKIENGNATNSGNTITLSWKEIQASNFGSYQVWYSEDPDASHTDGLEPINPTVTKSGGRVTYTFDIPTAGKYFFFVEAIATDSNSNNSGVVKLKDTALPITQKLAQPSFNVVPNGLDVQFSWTKVPYADSYTITVTKDGVAQPDIKIDDGNATTHTGTFEAGTYAFTIIAHSTNSLIISSDPLGTSPATVTLSSPALAAPNLSYQSKTLSWNAINGAAKYIIYQSITGPDSGYEYFAETSSTSYSLSSLAAGTYYFKVQAIDGSGGSSLLSNYQTVVIDSGGQNNRPSAPSIHTGSRTNNALSFYWYPVTGATSYRVYYRNGLLGTLNWKDVTTSSSTYFMYTLNNLSSNSSYYIYVTAWNAYGESVASNTITMTTTSSSSGGSSSDRTRDDYYYWSSNYRYNDSSSSSKTTVSVESIGSSGTYQFRVDLPILGFMDAYIDGEKITRGTHYKLRSGSTILTLTDSYISSLKTGKHTLRMDFVGGIATMEFNVDGSTSGSTTGGTSNSLPPVLDTGATGGSAGSFGNANMNPTTGR